MNAHATIDDATTLALRALIATLGEPKRAERFLALTGLDADELRARAAEPALLAAAIGFLENHEPDLLLVADEIGTTPASLVTARAALESGVGDV